MSLAVASLFSDSWSSSSIDMLAQQVSAMSYLAPVSCDGDWVRKFSLQLTYLFDAERRESLHVDLMLDVTIVDCAVFKLSVCLWGFTIRTSPACTSRLRMKD